MDKVLLIAGNAFRETLSMKLVYAVILVGFGLMLLMLLPMAYFDFIMDSGEEEMIDYMMYYFVNLMLDGFWFITVVLAMLLGSMAVSGEIKRRTIVTVLARPIERWQFMLGRWLGIAAFLLIVQSVGVILSAALIQYLQIFPNTLMVVKVAEVYLTVLLYLTVALALGAVLSTAASFALTVVLLMVLPEVIDGASRSPYPLVRSAMDAVSYFVPAKMPEDILENSFTTSMLNPNYTLYAQVLAENALYGAAIFCIGALLFSRRQIIAGS